MAAVVEKRTGKYGEYYGTPWQQVSRALTEDEMKVNAAYIYRYLTAAGWTINAIAGACGNIQNESAFNPGRWQGDKLNVGPAYGLIQWDGGEGVHYRKHTDWATNNGYSDPSTMDCCLDHLIIVKEWIARWSNTTYNNSVELAISWDQYTKSTEDAYTLACVFCWNAEGPYVVSMLKCDNGGPNDQAKAAEKTKRGNSGKFWYDYLLTLGGTSSPDQSDQPDTPDPPDQPEESKTTSYLYIGSKTYTPHIFINGKWKSVTPYLKTTGGWICGATTEKEDTEVNPNPTPTPTPTPVDPSTIWTRRSRPEDNNPYYNRVGTKQGALSTCILGSPNASTLNVLRNCVGAAWGGYNETWAKNAPNNGPPGGFCAKPVDAHRTLDECMTDPVLKEYVVYSRDIKDPDNYVPPLGGIIVYSNQHVVYISHVFDKDNIEIQQSSWGGLSGGEGPEGSPWYNSDNGLWGITKVKRNGATKNLWWFQSGNGAGNSCLGFVKNPAFLYDENGNCIGKRY